MKKTIFIILSLCVVYLGYEIMSTIQYQKGHREMRKRGYARSAVKHFSNNLYDYLYFVEDPVIYTDLKMMVDEILSIEAPWGGLLLTDDKFLEDLKDGKDIYGTEYIMEVDIEEGEVVLRSSILDGLKPEGVERSVTKIDFNMVKVLDADGNQVHIGEQ